MATDTYYTDLIKDFTLEFLEKVEETKLDTIASFKQFVEKQAPAERLRFYHLADWLLIREQAPDLYAEASYDALTLAEQERQEQVKQLQEWEHAQYIEAAAFKPQLAPYGQTLGGRGAQQLGFEVPLGRFG